MKFGKKTFYPALPFLAILLASNTILKTEGSHPGSTGGPGDLTCAQHGCHEDAQMVYNAVNNNTFTFSSPDSTYMPNQVYQLTIKVRGGGPTPCVKFGFETVALKDADSLNVGYFGVTDPQRTQLIDHIYQSNTRYSVTHKGNGTPAISNDYNEWTMNWSAPPNNVGKITFWYATMVTNFDGDLTGDKVCLSSFSIKPNPAIYLKEYNKEFGLSLFYKKEERLIELQYDAGGKKDIILTMMDANGKPIQTLERKNVGGRQKEIFKIGEDIPAGTYFFNVTSGNLSNSKKIIID